MLCTLDVEAMPIQNLVATIYVFIGLLINLTSSNNSVGTSAALYDSTKIERVPSLKLLTRQCDFLCYFRKLFCILKSKYFWV